MNSQGDFSQLFFSSSGRLARTPFFVAVALLLACGLAFDALAAGAFERIAGWFVYAFLLFTGACVLSKRLHDRGRSGWWAGLILLALMLVWARPRGVVDYIALAALIVAAVDLVLMPGQTRANRYGKNPKELHAWTSKAPDETAV